MLVRASDGEEARPIVNHIVNEGFVSIAVANQNDAYGNDVLASRLKALRTHDLGSVSTAALQRTAASGASLQR
ncbi:hypothetical protein WB44_09915 [Synechococcus sp. WH 8020]|uniref:hypothetical protein n=1 Tax=Synechococcus sp. (strain WH8020) TaxID=32052 RepID=UPI0006526EC2|nr:hypothetical protein [Synechococcus sp. WH 8020]AKN61354.1 hypothetical protein WB44_09915 [Synechococcus sp. WH 8020]